MNRKGKNNPNHRHGGTGTRLHAIWAGMKGRCLNPRDKAYRHYGGRGIRVCRQWVLGFPAFQQWATANGYRDNLEIDRRNNNRGYSPANCRWSTRSQQLRNTRRSTKVRAFGETKTIADWAEDKRCVVNPITLRTRIQRGTSPKAAITCKRIFANQFMRRES